MLKKVAKSKSSIHKKASSIRKKEIKKKRTPIKKQKKTRPIPKKTPKPIYKIIHKKTRDTELEKKLIENSISLQKVLVNVSAKFDNLANQISKLLELFEISAKSLAKRDFKLEKSTKDDERIIQKLDNLGEQNKIIARGLTLMHDRVPEESGAPRLPQAPPRQMPRPPQQIMPPPMSGVGEEQYQKSLSSEPVKFKKLKSSSEKSEK